MIRYRLALAGTLAFIFGSTGAIIAVLAQAGFFELFQS